MFTVKECTFQTTIGNLCGYLIENESVDPVDLMWVNHYLHFLAQKSDATAYQYAHRLCRFLAYLEKRGKTFWDCTDEDIIKYLRQLQYDTSTPIVSIVEQCISYPAAAAYYYPVRGFYLFLHNCRQPIKPSIKYVMRYNRDRYLQGIAPVIEAPDLAIENSLDRGAPAREYIKWYSNEQKEALLNAFRTLRDKAIFSIGLDGFRIDEILSSSIDDYDKDTATLTPYRSKRKEDGSEERHAPLSERSVMLLEKYKINERDLVEMEIEETGGRMPRELFVVLRHGESFGKPLKYRAFWQNLKTAAKRAGLEPAKTRTHSGRSTRANEVFTDYAENPEKWTEEEILELFGWKSMRSAAPYINHNDPDRRKAIARKINEIDKKRRSKREERDEKS